MNIIDTPWRDRALVIEGAADAIDPLEWFTPGDLAPLSQFHLEKRRNEWILSRVVLKQLARELGICGDIRRCSLDRPYVLVDGVRTGWLASVSHSHGHAGAAIARSPVGIDVQVVRPIAEWSTHLFLSEAEVAEMQRCTIADRVLHFWCAKEAAWKQRSDEFATMKQLPLVLEEERDSGLAFDCVETLRVADLIVAITRVR